MQHDIFQEVMSHFIHISELLAEDNLCSLYQKTCNRFRPKISNTTQRYEQQK